MKRRAFLASAAAMFPAAELSAFAQFAAASQPSAAHAVPAGHVVAAGEDRLGEHHSRGFSSILFKLLPSETNGGLFILEHANLVQGGPPLHMHPAQEEWFYVIEGEVVFQVGDSRKQLRPGDSILGPRNVPHTFSAIAGKPGRMLIAFNPAGKMEEFLRVTAVPNPPVQDTAFFARYDMKLIGPNPITA